METRHMRASELYAFSQGHLCEGKERCHWCTGPCTQKWMHDDIPHQPFRKSAQLPRYVAGPYVCAGCWLWRRKSLTAWFLDGGFKDRQEPKKLSWLITVDGAKAVKTGRGNFLD